METDPIVARALQMAHGFLKNGRPELMELAQDDLEKLRASASSLKAAAVEHTGTSKGADQIAYVLVASAFNQVLGARRGHADGDTSD